MRAHFKKRKKIKKRKTVLNLKNWIMVELRVREFHERTFEAESEVLLLSRRE